MTLLPLRQFTNERWLADQLRSAGLSRQATVDKAALFARCAQSLIETGEPHQLATAWFVPGRIEVLGKHTDYAGGRSVVAAVEQGFCCVAVPATDATIRIRDLRRDEQIAFAISPHLVPAQAGWGNYAMTVARRVARNFPRATRGCAMTMASDLPAAAGMSSSSALVVTIFLMLADVNDIWSCRRFGEHVRTRQQLAEYLGTVENGQSFRGLAGDRGVGTFGGSEDHTAILCARPGRLAQYSYCPVRFERSVPLPPDLTFALGASGVVAEKTGAALEKYNRVSALAMQLSKLWQSAVGGEFLPLADILADPAGNRYERLYQTVQDAALPVQLRESLLKRLRHFYEESCQIIPAVPDNLASADNRLQFAELVDRSQDQGAELLGNQVPETVFLAQAARGLGGLTASAFGAGFGGSVWAMVDKSTAESFCRQWRNVYRQRFPEVAGRSEFLVSGAGPAAFRLGREMHLFGTAERDS